MASGNGAASTVDVARRAVEQVATLTGRRVEGVLGLKKNGNDGWEVVVEVLELERIPDSTDVMASYEVSLDKSGELREYRRTRRYARSSVEEV
jgi:hypothetical protein